MDSGEAILKLRLTGNGQDADNVAGLVQRVDELKALHQVKP